MPKWWGHIQSRKNPTRNRRQDNFLWRYFGGGLKRKQALTRTRAVASWPDWSRRAISRRICLTTACLLFLSSLILATVIFAAVLLYFSATLSRHGCAIERQINKGKRTWKGKRNVTICPTQSSGGRGTVRASWSSSSGKLPHSPPSWPLPLVDRAGSWEERGFAMWPDSVTVRGFGKVIIPSTYITYLS